MARKQALTPKLPKGAKAMPVPASTNRLPTGSIEPKMPTVSKK